MPDLFPPPTRCCGPSFLQNASASASGHRYVPQEKCDNEGTRPPYLRLNAPLSTKRPCWESFRLADRHGTALPRESWRGGAGAEAREAALARLSAGGSAGLGWGGKAPLLRRSGGSTGAFRPPAASVLLCLGKLCGLCSCLSA